jgi:DNA-binding transcriptional LysR family regulator
MARTDIDTALLRTFMTLQETRNFSRTAERVGRSQSAVSAQVQKLEDLLGCRLFDRDKRNVRLTIEGEALIGHAARILAETEALAQRFSAEEVIGEVRFGAPEDFATFYLPGVLQAFAEAFPRVGLHVACDLTVPLIEQFEAGAFDLIVIKQDLRALHRGAEPLRRERLVWAGGPRAQRAMSLAQAAALWPGRPLPLVLAPAPCVYRARAIRALDEAGIAWSVVYTSPSLAGAAAAVKAGLGLTVLPRALAPDGLVVFDGERGWPALPDASLCLLAGERAPPAAQALARFIQERLPA